jgi:hypothetical protein
MKKNLNNPDRIIRTIAGLVVLFFVLNGTITGTLGILLAIGAIVIIATGAVSFCPIYALLGISTNKSKQESKATA